MFLSDFYGCADKICLLLSSLRIHEGTLLCIKSASGAVMQASKLSVQPHFMSLKSLL